MARLFSARTLVLGGLAVAGAATALKNRRKVAGAIGAGDSTQTPAPPPAEAAVGQPAAEPGPSPAPDISNVDAAGPPENTATHVPAPEPQVHDPAGGIDEEAEEAAAAAEAANIGGPPPDYPGSEHGELADEEERALIEAGEGESEGQEVAEFELEDNAEPAAGDPLEGGRQIDEVIEAQSDPFLGEVPADDNASHGNPRAEAEQSAVGTSEPLEAPGPGSDPTAPGARGETDAGDAPTPPNPGATTTDASAEQARAAASSPSTPAADTGGTLAAGSADEGAPTTGGTLSGAAGEPSPAAEESANAHKRDEEAKDDGEDDDGSEWQTWSGRAVEP